RARTGPHPGPPCSAAASSKGPGARSRPAVPGSRPVLLKAGTTSLPPPTRALSSATSCITFAASKIDSDRVPRRRPSQQPERDAAAGVEDDREREGDAVAAGHVEGEPGEPRAERRADAGAHGDGAEDGAELRAGKQVGGVRGDRRSARAPGKPEETRVQPQQQVLVGRRDEQRAYDAEDRRAVGDDAGEFAADAVGEPAGDDDARKREEGAEPEHPGGVDLVEADSDRE